MCQARLSQCEWYPTDSYHAKPARFSSTHILFRERLDYDTRMIGLRIVVRDCLIALVLRSHNVLFLVIRTLVRVLVLQATALDEMLREFELQGGIHGLDVLQRQLSNAGPPFLVLEVFRSRGDSVRGVFDFVEEFIDISMANVIGDEVPAYNVYGQRVAEMFAEAVIAEAVFFGEVERSGKLHGLSSLIEDNDSVSVLIQIVAMSRGDMTRIHG